MKLGIQIVFLEEKGTVCTLRDQVTIHTYVIHKTYTQFQLNTFNTVLLISLASRISVDFYGEIKKGGKERECMFSHCLLRYRFDWDNIYSTIIIQRYVYPV